MSEYQSSDRGHIVIPTLCSQVKFPVGHSASYTNENFTVNLQDGVKACDVGYFTIWCRQARQLFTQIEIPQDLFVSLVNSVFVHTVQTVFVCVCVHVCKVDRV